MMSTSQGLSGEHLISTLDIALTKLWGNHPINLRILIRLMPDDLVKWVTVADATKRALVSSFTARSVGKMHSTSC